MIPLYSSKFFRLPIGLAKDNFVVNTSRNSVSSVQFHSHKLLESWTLKQPHSFSCPVVYVPHKNELVCVKDKNVILIWSYEADSLNEAKEIKFQDAIFAIIPVEGLQLVVLNSGSCLLLEAALSKSEFEMKSYFKKEENLLWADASLQESKVIIFLLTSCKAEARLHILLLNTNDGQTEKLSEQIISRDSSSLQSWCLISQDTQISFITIWSDGQVHSYNTYSKSSKHLWTVPGIRDKELLALETIDSYHVVVVRFHPSCGCSYEIWDVQYAARKTQKSIDLAVPENLQVTVLDNTLFIPSSQGIVAEPLNVTPSTLAAVVGKSTANSDEMQDVVYTWTSDGMLLRVDIEESSSDISNSKFSTITTNKMFQEFLSELHGQNAETISSYLSKIKFISESKLVKLLQYLLREHHPEFSEKSSKRKVSSKESKKNIVDIFLALFLISYDEIYLQQNLRKLSFKEVMATLEILKMLLKQKFFNTAVWDGAIWSSYVQVLTWTCVMLYAHTAEIVLSGEKEMLVMKHIHKALIKKLAESDNWEDLVKPKKIDFESSTTSLYCIEVLYL